MPSIISLTQEERDKFSAWLIQDAESNRGIVEQMEKLTHAEAVVKHKKQQMAACIIVAKMLNSIEDQIIGS